MRLSATFLASSALTFSTSLRMRSISRFLSSSFCLRCSSSASCCWRTLRACASSFSLRADCSSASSRRRWMICTRASAVSRSSATAAARFSNAAARAAAGPAVVAAGWPTAWSVSCRVDARRARCVRRSADAEGWSASAACEAVDASSPKRSSVNLIEPDAWSSVTSTSPRRHASVT